MRHLHNAGISQHPKHHIQIARRLASPSERWSMGAAMVNEMRELLARPYPSRYASPWAALEAGGLVRTFWVAKRPAGGLRRGHKVFSKAARTHYEAMGATFREVRCPKRKCVKDALKRMARRIEIHHEAQYGFVSQRDCIQSAERHANARTVYMLDIENAFDQIGEAEVVEMLRKVYRLKHAWAREIARLCCVDGHLYQGNPMAPALFNVRALWMAERLSRLCQSVGAQVTIYADDITISHARWGHFSKGFQRTVRRIISECGLKVNPEKCKVRRVSPLKVGSFDITGLAIDYDALGIPHVRPMHRRRTRKKANYLRRLEAQGIERTRELAKDGSYKSIRAVADGLENWAEKTSEPRENPQLTLSNLVDA